MQYNIYYIELLGEENLKGVTIPVIVDNRKSLTSENMADIAKILNTYRTVFVRSSVSDTLKTKVYSVRGETPDCLYASVVAIYSLTESYYIREIESGEKSIIVETADCKNKVSIEYENMSATGVTHEISFPELNYIVSDEKSNFRSDIVEDKNSLNSKVRIIYTEDSVEFSKFRKKLNDYITDDSESIIVHYDRVNDMIFFNVQRSYEKTKKLDSRTQIGFIVKYLLDMGILKESLTQVCHVLNTGQYAIMNISIKDSKIEVRMNARTIIEGILNI